MYSRDYSKEIGLYSGVKIVPLSVAIPILGVVAAVALVGVMQGGSQPSGQKSPDMAASVAAPTGSTLARR